MSGITQVASPSELYPVHNRLTHTLKVAQVGRSLARKLLDDLGRAQRTDDEGGLDPDVVEAAALAHDLGHPPFGHVAEKTLDELLLAQQGLASVRDGYDGNAQSFRIVTKLAVRKVGEPGLNLTRATLNAILKYPWLQTSEGVRRNKWGAFVTEAEDFRWSREMLPSRLAGKKTLEASLMDWADDITYAVHDLEDFFRAGLIPLDRFAEGTRELDYFFRDALKRLNASSEVATALTNAFLRTEIITIGMPGPYRGSRVDRAALRTQTSRMISRYVNHSVSFAETTEGLVLRIDPELEDEVTILKQLTSTYVIESQSLIAQRFGQRTLITSLFRTLCEAAASADDLRIFPLFFRDEIERANNDTKQVKRIVADLIASMSEAQVVAVHQRLTGQSLGSAAEAYLQ